MSKKVTDKIKEILTPKDLKVFEAAVDNMVSERVAMAEEELKSKYDQIAEEYVQKKVVEDLEAEKAKLVEEYDVKLQNLEKKIVTKLDSFLDHVITEQISDEALNKIAINEVAFPVIEGIKKVFNENYLELDSDGSRVVKEAEKMSKDLEEQLSEQISKNMELEERLEKTASYLLISEKTEGLTRTQKSRVVKMFKDKSFDEVKDKIGTFIEMVKETPVKKEEVKESVASKRKTIDSIISEGDHIAQEKLVINETEDVQPTFAGQANRFL